MIPTSIDGTDITGATIDGTDVTEITVDGDTVFSAQTLPVAYSNLVAWYPFDSATYGGSNADDVTAIIGGSGDDTAYDGTVNGATYQSSGGVTEINSGVNSGAFDFAADNIAISSNAIDGTRSIDQTIMGWMFPDGDQSRGVLFGALSGGFDTDFTIRPDESVRFHPDANNFADSASSVVTLNDWNHLAITLTNNSFEVFIDASQVTMTTQNGNPSTNNLSVDSIGKGRFGGFDGVIDDFRVYNTILSQSQINQIYQNTEP